jgi:hypothetical protein
VVPPVPPVKPKLKPTPSKNREDFIAKLETSLNMIDQAGSKVAPATATVSVVTSVTPTPVPTPVAVVEKRTPRIVQPTAGNQQQSTPKSFTPSSAASQKPAAVTSTSTAAAGEEEEVITPIVSPAAKIFGLIPLNANEDN